MTYKNSEKIHELKAEFKKLQESEDCKFAPDIDGFIDFLAEKIIRLEKVLRMWERLGGGEEKGDLKIKKY